MTNTLAVSHASLSWVHFGDLHVRSADEENYMDFLQLIEEANEHLASKIGFALLPGDNADDGLEAQYELVREALHRLKLPVHSITGDHDRKAGTLDPRSSVDHENAIGAYPVKGIPGTELGPNEKGTKGPWPSWRGR